MKKLQHGWSSWRTITAGVFLAENHEFLTPIIPIVAELLLLLLLRTVAENPPNFTTDDDDESFSVFIDTAIPMSKKKPPIALPIAIPAFAAGESSFDDTTTGCADTDTDDDAEGLNEDVGVDKDDGIEVGAKLVEIV